MAEVRLRPCSPLSRLNPVHHVIQPVRVIPTFGTMLLFYHRPAGRKPDIGPKYSDDRNDVDHSTGWNDYCSRFHGTDRPMNRIVYLVRVIPILRGSSASAAHVRADRRRSA